MCPNFRLCHLVRLVMSTWVHNSFVRAIELKPSNDAVIAPVEEGSITRIFGGQEFSFEYLPPVF
jgi:hypothetical protein